MAMGRSNSLSLNTGAANSIFGQQPSQQQNNPPSQAGSLFGGPASATQTQQPGGLFGGTSTSNTSGGLFGNNTSTTQQQQSGGLFGNNTNPQTSGAGLFGNTAKPAGGSLFGNMNTQQPQQQPSNLFQNPQPAQSNNAGGGLFGSTNQATQPQNNSNLFGNSSLFGQSQQPQQPTLGTSIFGMNAVHPNQLNASLLGASQFRASQMPSQLPGRLSMGQGQPPPNQQSAQVGAVKVHANDLRGTTRFTDCIEDVKIPLEKMDNMIAAQEKFCREIQALLTKHEQDVSNIAPSVGVIRDQVKEVEMVLTTDAQIVDSTRTQLKADHKDVTRVQRVAENLLLPAGYHAPNSSNTLASNEDYDTDLIGNYFIPMTTDLQQKLTQYSSNLSEIENHMRVVEASAVQQAQSLAAKRAGVGGGNGGDNGDTVKDLAETLRGFEASILGVAGAVGECREGVDELILGQMGGRRW
ncbi:hypothetical protein LTR62_003969 [Meristemomyces frigidus]|uniref:Nucleoporin NUP49/NSP49 n=1 Tax=Meristemomyces frigidus TaxID=1508187 RepID=A0AAN7YRI8_9PEZI|nr:hypothetical protein LTR62_003969 [Meristemomyces frigidus]